MNRKNRQSRAFFLFGRCKSVHEVAEELDISYKEARNLKNLYLSANAIDDGEKEDATDFYRVAAEREQLVNGVIGKISRQLEERQVWRRIEMIRSYFPDAIEILFFFPAIEVPLAWSLGESSAFLDRIQQITYN